MATSTTTTGQRIFIWFVLVFTVLSTFALFAGSMLAQNNANDQAREEQRQTEELQQIVLDYQEQLSAQASELSELYYDAFKEYEDSPRSFNAANVTELTTRDLVVGDGEEIGEDSDVFYAYYIGWKPDGVVFDSSFESGALGSPLVVEKSGDFWPVIDGWSEGVMGMRIGGIRELTIPADMAYGETGSPSEDDADRNIDPDTPLKFIIMLIPEFEQVPEPDWASLGF